MSVEGTEAAAAVELVPEMSARDGFVLVLGGLLADVGANWQGTLDDEDPEFLHQLRIALRRTRTVLGNAAGILDDDARSTYRTEFGWLAGLTGPTRDLDAFSEEWDRYTADFTEATVEGLDPVRARLAGQRAAAFAAMYAAMRSLRAGRLLEDWSSLLAVAAGTNRSDEAGGFSGPKADQTIGHILAHLLRRAHRRVIDDGRLIGPDSPAQALHDLRKDAKRLRYLVECFADVFPKQSRKRFIAQLKGLQDNLGAHQDAIVHVEELRRIADDLIAEASSPDAHEPPAGELVALGELIEHLGAAERTARAEFADRFADFDSDDTAHLVRHLRHAIDEH